MVGVMRYPGHINSLGLGFRAGRHAGPKWGEQLVSMGCTS